MKISVIDVGSNSVRLATFADGKTLYKRLATTRLGEGIAFTGRMKPEAIERTAAAIRGFAETAKREGAQKIYVFATAAVRSSDNRSDFLNCVKKTCNLTVDVVDGETEAGLALAGALGGRDGGVIDIGGASTEITVKVDGARVFSKSVNIGAVRLYDAAGRDRDKLEKIIEGKLEEYGGFTAENYDMYGVSGTVTTLAALKLGLKEYDANAVQGQKLTLAEVENYANKLLETPVEEICKMLTVDTRRADIIGDGALLLLRLMQRMKINGITVSDSDNLEGYLLLKEGQL